MLIAYAFHQNTGQRRSKKLRIQHFVLRCGCTVWRGSPEHLSSKTHLLRHCGELLTGRGDRITAAGEGGFDNGFLGTPQILNHIDNRRVDGLILIRWITFQLSASPWEINLFSHVDRSRAIRVSRQPDRDRGKRNREHYSRNPNCVKIKSHTYLR